MEPLLRNSLLFFSGFIVALVLFRHPESLSNLKDYNDSIVINSATTTVTASNQNPIQYNSTQRPDSTPPHNSRSARNSNNFRNTRPSLDSVPNLPEQIPTAPPTGQPKVEGEEENSEESAASAVVNNQPSSHSNSSYQNNDKTINSNEASFSSMMPFVGMATTDQSTKSMSQGSRSGSAGSGGGGFLYGGSGGGPSSGADNTEFDISDDFTPSGLQSAKRLYTNKSITEAEYLEYISTGLESSNTSHKSSAAIELVNLKTHNSFAVQAQFAMASTANTQIINRAVTAAYRTPGDLVFLSQKISDNSSVATQEWAIHSLEMVIRGSNMDFNNQQVRDTLVNNVYSSLVGLDANHPSYEQARSISNDINSKLS